MGYRSSPLAVWELDLAEEMARQHDLEDVADVLWHPFSGEIFGRQASGFIFKWNPDVSVYEKQRVEVSVMTISSDGTLLAVGSHKGSFKLLSTSDMTIMYQGVSEHPVSGLAFSCDNQQLYDIRGNYGTVWQPDSLLRFSEPSNQLSDGGSVSGKSARTASAEETRYEFLDPISALAPETHGDFFCSGSEGGVVTIHDKKNRKRRILDDLTGFGIEQIAWSSDGRNICVGDLSRTIFLIYTNRDKQGVDSMSLELRFKLSLSINDNITQIIFDNDAALVLVSSRSRAVVVSLEAQNVVSELCLRNNNGMWVKHPAQPNSIIFFSPWLLTIYEWSTLSETASLLIAPPRQKHWTDSPSTHETGSSDLDDSRIDDWLGSHPADSQVKDLPQQVKIERLIMAHSCRYLLVEASTNIDGQRFNRLHLLDIHNLLDNKEGHSISPGGHPAQSSTNFLELPTSLIKCMGRPIVFLKQSSSMQDTLLFLDCRHSVCTWTIPQVISQMAGTVQPANTDLSWNAVDRRDSQASTLHARSYRGKDSGDKSVVAHYSLPGDWVSPDCVALVQAFANGALLCPRNGEVAVVHCAGLDT